MNRGLDREGRALARKWLDAVPTLLADADEAVTEAHQRGDAATANEWLDVRAEYREATALARRLLGR